MAEKLTSLAFCWVIERADGAGLALTSHDQPIEAGERSYQASPGMLPAAVVREAGLDGGSGEVSGAMTSSAISELDLALGRWDGARIRLLAIDWRDPGTETDLLGGRLGEVESGSGGFAAEIEGASGLLDRPVCPATTPECRAEFGDRLCRVDLSGRSTRRRLIACNGTEMQLDAPVDANFQMGRIRFLDGDNCGISGRILAVEGDRVQVRDLPTAPVEAGCRVELREGCDKRLESCAARFANVANFRGEPHLPGTDLLTRYPGA